MRRLSLLVLSLLGACADGPGPLWRYLHDPATRREALLEALWYRDNDYARLRLARYATGREDSWERLPLWRPPTAPVTEDAAPPRPEAFAPLSIDLPEGPEEALQAALSRLGEAAFFDYPAQLVAGFERALASPDPSPYGLWRGAAPAAPGVARRGGLLFTRPPDGDVALALSCSTCHAGSRSGEGAIVPGLPNVALDVGLLQADQAPPGAQVPGAGWGPGRLDVSPDGLDDPSAIPDLRPVRWQRYLHHDATLRHAGPLALAVRIETLIITSLHQGAAPPPAIALGLALYLRGLQPEAAPPPDPAIAARGAQVFQARCAGCHLPPDLAGEPLPVAQVGTDPALGRSPERGTGTYRVPTLRGVSGRERLLHDGSVAGLPALLDEGRLASDHPGGPQPGHGYGLDLGPQDRAALIAFVSTL